VYTFISIVIKILLLQYTVLIIFPFTSSLDGYENSSLKCVIINRDCVINYRICILTILYIC